MHSETHAHTKHKYKYQVDEFLHARQYKYKELWLDCCAMLRPRDTADVSTSGVGGGIPLENVVQ